MILNINAVISNLAMQSDGIVQWYLMYRGISMYKSPINVKNNLSLHFDKALKRMKKSGNGKEKMFAKIPYYDW